MRENAERFKGFKGDVQYELYTRAEDDAIAHIFFEDDNMEHMAFSVVGRWGKPGVMTIRISEAVPIG